ncbi:transposase [Anoxybacillus ayderensis]|uniref:transposase n=1 Tax=Anoxybacillus ayderensis TaxID=265546 RepID=UPI003CCDCA2F
MVSIESARGSLLEKRIPRHRHAQNEPDSLSERRCRPSEAVGSLDRTRRHSPRHGGRRSLSRLSLRRSAQRSRSCGGAACLKADQPMTPEHLHCVLSTDRGLSDEEILRYYAKRWSIEYFFRQAKDQLKLDGYRVRQVRAVKRYWDLGAACLCVQPIRIEQRFF